MRAIRVVWKDETEGEVLKDATVPYEGAISCIGDAVTVEGPLGSVRLTVEFHFDPPVPR